MKQYGFYFVCKQPDFSTDLDGPSLGVKSGQKGVDVMTEFGAGGIRAAGVFRPLMDGWVSRKGKRGARVFSTNHQELGQTQGRFPSGPRSGPGKWDTLRQGDEKS